jgi:hypothetical protein
VTAAELQQAEAAYRAAHAGRETAREARNAAIRAAAAEGWTQRAIADAVGLTASRVGEITKGINTGRRR